MRKRLALQAMLGGAILTLAFCLTHWLLSPFPGVTQDNCDRLRPGMSQQQVEVILGGPPDDVLWAVDDQGKLDGAMVWFGPDAFPRGAHIRVTFDERKKVVSARYWSG